MQPPPADLPGGASPRGIRRRTALGLLAAGGCPALGSAAEIASGEARRFLANAYVFDGVMQPRPRGGRWPREPGYIKRLTGIDAAAMTLGEDSLDSVNEFLERHEEVYCRVETAADLDRARREGRHGILYYFQSRFRLDPRAERLRDWHRRGLRVFQPTYAEENELGGGFRAPEARLTPLGETALARCNELGIVVDVSHCGEATVLDLAERTAAPLTANHVNAAALAPTPRNMCARQLQAVADTGGVVGVFAISTFLSPSRRRKATLEDFVAQIEHLVGEIGIDHVGIATDAFLDGRSNSAAHEGDPPLNTPERWFHLVDALRERNFDRPSLEKLLGGNFKRVCERILASGA